MLSNTNKLCIRTHIKNVQGLLMLLNAIIRISGMARVAGTGATFRKRLALLSDDQLDGFIGATETVAQFLEPMARNPQTVEFEIGANRSTM